MEYIELVQSRWVHFLDTSLAFVGDSFAVCCTHPLVAWALHLCVIQRKPVNTRSKQSPKPKHMPQLSTISLMEVRSLSPTPPPFFIEYIQTAHFSLQSLQLSPATSRNRFQFQPLCPTCMAPCRICFRQIRKRMTKCRRNLLVILITDQFGQFHPVGALQNVEEKLLIRN